MCDLDLIPVAADTFGSFVMKGERFLAQLFSRFARRFANDSETSLPAKPQHNCWQRALRKAVDLQFGSAYSQCGGVWAHPFPGDGGEGEESASPSHQDGAAFHMATPILCTSPAFGCMLAFPGSLFPSLPLSLVIRCTQTDAVGLVHTDGLCQYI